MNNIKKDILEPSPTPSLQWSKLSHEDKISKIRKHIVDFPNFIEGVSLHLSSLDKNGQVLIKYDGHISAQKRGIFFLDLEIYLKENIDHSLTIWVEHTSDKSKLRSLRGIDLKIE